MRHISKDKEIYGLKKMEKSGKKRKTFGQFFEDAEKKLKISRDELVELIKENTNETPTKIKQVLSDWKSIEMRNRLDVLYYAVQAVKYAKKNRK